MIVLLNGKHSINLTCIEEELYQILQLEIVITIQNEMTYYKTYYKTKDYKNLCSLSVLKYYLPTLYSIIGKKLHIYFSPQF